MIDINRTIWYKDISINFDDFGYYTVQYAGDDIIFMTVKEAKDFIDKEF